MIISEGVLIEIALEILGRNGMIDARDATFQEAPKALNGVCVDVAHDIDLRSVVNTPMPIPHSGETIVARKFIGVDVGTG
jgi:hypothetical protein